MTAATPRPTATDAARFPRPAEGRESGRAAVAAGADRPMPAEAETADSALAGPERRCIVTRQVRPKAALIRFVVGPDDAVVPDIEGKLPGRGLWVLADRAVLEQAAAKNAFARAARRKVQVPDGLAGQVETLLERRLVQLLSLARGAGEAVAGFVKVEDRLRAARGAASNGVPGGGVPAGRETGSDMRQGRVALVFAARDGAADGRRKIAGLAAGAGAPVVDVLDADALGRAFGREAVVHAAVAAGGLAERLAVEAARLDGIRRAGDDAPASKG